MTPDVERIPITGSFYYVRSQKSLLTEKVRVKWHQKEYILSNNYSDEVLDSTPGLGKKERLKYLGLLIKGKYKSDQILILSETESL